MLCTARSRNQVPYLVLFLICCTQLSFGVNGQETEIPDKRISFSAKNTSLGFVLKKLAKVSGITIFYSTAEIAPFNNVSVNVKDTPFSDVMRELLDGRGLMVIPVNETAVTVTKKVIPPTPTPSIPFSDTVISVSGKVVNEEGQPIVGASVGVVGANKGATTDVNGIFTVKGVSASSTLAISAVSVLPQQIPVKGRSNIGTVLMKLSISDLDETVVKGYYNTTKRLNTGTVITLKGQDIEQQPVTNPLVAMIGRVPNLVVTPSSGLPNGSVNLQLRGQNSLSGTSLRSEPLIVVDGVPYQNNLNAGYFGSFGLVKDKLSALSFINVNDIDQINVLSDADATSIYGSRGGNGVILITTKRGKAGATTTNLSVTTGVSKVSKKLDLLSTQQYLEMRKQAYLADGLNAPNKQSPNKDYSNFDLTVWDQNRYTDWQEEFLGNSATSYNANLSVTGGSSVVQYLIGGNYNTQKYVYPGDNAYKMGTANFNISGGSENGKFRSSLSGSYSFNTSNSPNSDLTYLAVTLAPNAPNLFTDNGSLNWEPDPDNLNNTGTWQNPLSRLLRTSTTSNNNLRGSIDMSYKLTDRISAKASAGYSEIRTRNSSLIPIVSFDPSNSAATGTSTLTNLTNRSFTFDPQLNYTSHIVNGTLDALVGFSYQSQSQQNESFFGQGYTSDALLKNISSAGIAFSANNTSQYKYAALFGRLSYNWRNKYLLNVTGRRDGSSRFGPGYQFGNFWSTGLAWIFSEEERFKKLLPFMSFGKLRTSYGTNGNDGIGDYQYLELYEAMENISYQNIRPIRSQGVINPDYHWETVHKFEIALETGFLGDRILFNTSFWRTRSSDQLGTYQLPATTGANNITANQDARIQNQGWDFILTSKNIASKNFVWSTVVNFGIQNNKLLSLPANIYNGFGYNRFIMVGQPFSGFTPAYVSKGVNQANGLYQFMESDGNVNTNKDNGYFEGTKITTRPLTLGISNSVSFKMIELSFFVQLTRQYGRNYLFDYAFITKNPGSFSSEPEMEYGNLPVEYLSYWKRPGDFTNIAKITSKNYSEPLSPLLNKAHDSDMGWVDASFIRLRNVSLSYSIPKEITNKWSLKDFRIYMQAQNLLTVTNYKGLDPEIQSVTSLPLLRTITVGIHVAL